MLSNYILLIVILFTSAISLAQPVIEEALTINDIPSDKILTNEEQAIVKEEIKDKILIDLTPIKNDYVDEDHRGTVEFQEVSFDPIPEQGGRVVKKFGNYSLHKTIIPDGAVIQEVNFSQTDPHTIAIEGKNLTFIDCNLTNVEIDPSWTLIRTNKTQRTITKEVQGNDVYQVTRVEQKDGSFSVITNELISPLPIK